MAAAVTSAAQWPAEALREAFNDAFSDYVAGAPELAPAAWPDFLNRQGIDLEASLVAVEDDRIVAFSHVAPLPDGRTRLATMGARREARGSGAARELLALTIARSRERGDRWIELEVFAQNPRAVALYRSHGFEAVVELYGFERAAGIAPTAIGDGPIEIVEIADALRWLDAAAIDALPWQVGAQAMARYATPPEAWRHGRAQLLFNLRGEQRVVVASLVDLDAQQRDARVLLRALAQMHPQAVLVKPQLQRLDLGGEAMHAEGWQRLALHQQLMRCRFDH
jgi:ribosomal protein S18 acetylase RimI-like enzyme